MDLESLLTRQDIPKDVKKIIENNLAEFKKNESNYRSNEALLRTLLNVSHDMSILLDKEGIILEINKNATKELGKTINEIKGRYLFDIFPPDIASIGKIRFKEVINSKKPIKFKSEKDGRIFDYILYPVLNENNQVIKIAWFSSSSTGRERAKNEEREALKIYKRIIEQMEESVSVEDAEGIITFVNPRYLEMSGFKENELVGKHWSVTVPPEDIERVKIESNKRPKGISSTYISTTLTKSGSIIPIIVTSNPFFSNNGVFAGVLSVFNDITNQKNVEKELREARDKYQLLVEKLNEGVILENEEGILSFVNPRLLEMHGYSEDEVIGKHWKILVAPEDQKNVQAQTDKRQEGIVSHYESDGRKKDGSLFPVSVTATPIFSDDGDYKGVLSVVVDITERKQAEEALKESKEKYQMLVDKLNEGVILEDREGYYKFVNPKTAQLVGYTEEELIGKHWSSIIADSHVDIVQNEFSKRPKGVSSTYEAYVQTKDGRPIPVIISATPIFTKTGEFDGVLGVFTDITKQKEVEHDLRKSEEKYHMLVEKLEEALMVEDSEGKITFVNPKTVEILGYSEEEIIGKHWSTFITDEYVDIGYKETAKHMKGISSIYESSLKSKDGTGIPVIITATPIFSSSGEFDGVIALATNITERKQVEQKLIQVKQQEERYHAMLSHFINNDMQKIINNLELLALMYESDLGIDRNIVDKAMTIASGSSKTIEAVNKIFAILQSTFIIPDKSFNLLNILNEVIAELSKDPRFFEINKKELYVELKIDSNFKDVLRGLFLFVFSSKDLTPDTKIDIQGSFFPSYYSIIISDSCSKPLSNDIISKLSGNITDEWEVIGHNIDIALASVIMKHYGGSLIIQSLTHKGNEFQLLFPLDIVKPLNEIESF